MCCKVSAAMAMARASARWRGLCADMLLRLRGHEWEQARIDTIIARGLWEEVEQQVAVWKLCAGKLPEWVSVVQLQHVEWERACREEFETAAQVDEFFHARHDEQFEESFRVGDELLNLEAHIPEPE